VIDCATNPTPCEISVTNYQEPTEQATKSIAFDASLPLPPPPTATVTPSDGLADRQLVTVTGSGFSPNADVAIAECPSGTDLFANCSPYGWRGVRADANGDVSATLRVDRTLDVYTNSPTPTAVDCATSADPCEIVMGNSSDFLEVARTPVTFDPDATPLPGPSATVTPSTNLIDGQSVTIDGDGFTPGTQTLVVQCAAGGADAPHCDTTRIGLVEVDDSGHATATTTVNRIINVQTVSAVPAASATPIGAEDGAEDKEGATVDCASSPGACTLAVVILNGNGNEAAIVPLSFDPNGPGGPTGPNEVTPPTDTTATTDPPVTDDQTTDDDSDEVSSTELARTGATHTNDLTFLGVTLLFGGVALTLATRARRRGTSR
jgi:hypothetical protein